MTSDDILTHAPRLGFDDAHISEAICNWLREIAWQLAVANEQLCVARGPAMSEHPQKFSITAPQEFSLPNPFPALKSEIEKHISEIKHDVRVAVETEMLRESVRFFLSRLITLDPQRAAEYENALKLL